MVLASGLGQLRADSPDVLRDNGAAAFAIPAPQALVDAFPVEDLPGIHGKEFYDFKFFFGQGNALAACVYRLFAEVDG